MRPVSETSTAPATQPIQRLHHLEHFRRQRFDQRHVGHGDASAGFQHARHFAPDLRLVGRKVDDAVGNDGVHGIVGDGQMLDFAKAEFDVVQAGFLPVMRDVVARLAEHFRRHVHADGAAGGANFASGDEHVETAAAAEIEHGFAGLQRGERGGIAAGKPHVRAVGQRLEFLDGVAEFARELFGLLRRGTAAGDARTAAAGGGFLRNFGVAFAHELAHGIILFVSLECFHKSAAFLPAADDGKVGLQNLFQLFRVGGGFIRPGERFVNPVQRLAHGDGRGLVRQPVINPALRLARKNQTGVMQDGKVLGDRGRREAEQLGDLADAQFAAPEREENPHPVRVGQRLGDGHEFAH